MRLILRSSGSLSGLIAAAPSTSTMADGSFAGDWPDGLTLGTLLESLGLAERAMLIIVEGRAVPVGERQGMQLSEGMQIALMPPIRAG